MIDPEMLKKIAKMNSLKPWQQEKHYVQSVVLTSLSEYPLVFKGGTYLWFFHGLDRFSEDLDFTANGKLSSDIGERTMESLRMLGIESSLKKIETPTGGISFRISAKGPLNSSEKDVCHVYVEISEREKVVDAPLPLKLSVEPYLLPVKIINGMVLNEVASEKIRAITTRKKARDVYDLAFLIRKKEVKFNLELANKKLAYYNLKFSKSEFTKKLEEKKKLWNPELSQLVFGKLENFDGACSEIMRWIERGNTAK